MRACVGNLLFPGLEVWNLKQRQGSQESPSAQIVERSTERLTVRVLRPSPCAGSATIHGADEKHRQNYTEYLWGAWLVHRASLHH